MPIDMPRGLPFSVDTFGPYTKKTKKRHHFLTHAHKDHTAGISVSNAVFPIYATSLTIYLVLQRCSKLDESLFISIDAGQTIIIDDPDGEFRVTAFDANHCPGAAMFLFEGNFGNILHTGDCRLSLQCLKTLPEKYVQTQGKPPQCHLDYIFLDCTFGRYPQRFPSKHSAIRQIINCIWRHPDAPIVYLACDLLGHEDVLIEIFRTFGSKIYVDKIISYECFITLMKIAPEIVSEDPSSRFHIFEGFPKLCERARAKLAEARLNLQPEPLIIRPSAQWYVYDDNDESLVDGSHSQNQRRVGFNEPIRDEFGIWHVCYSIHSSREELETALQFLSPKWVVSTTPFCRAMEMDYVKKNCIVSQISLDDSLWKLLDIDVVVTSTEAVSCPMIERSNQGCLNSQLEPIIQSSRMVKHSGFPSTQCECRESKDASSEIERLNLKEVGEDVQGIVTNETPGEVECSVEVSTEVNDEYDTENSKGDMRKEIFKGISSSIEPSKCISKDLRKLYRSMNAPVPRPLPSLVELMNARKRVRKNL